MTTTAVAASPLEEVRALRRRDWQGSALALAPSLARIHDVLDRESAGMLLTRPGAVEHLAQDGLTAMTVGLLASSTVSPLAPLLATAMAARGIAPHVVEVGYNRWEEEALASGPTLGPHAPGLSVLVLDDEIVLGRVVSVVDVAAVVAETGQLVSRLRRWLDAARGAWGGHVVLTTVPLSPRRRGLIRDLRGRNALEAAWNRMNAAILDLGSEPGCTVLALEQLGADVVASAPARTRLVSSQVHSNALLDAVARDVAAVAAATLGRSAKVLVLDLDDTLWGGVVGDDGVEGLRLGGGYPGNAFTQCQEAVQALQLQGIALAVCSKNEDEVARTPFVAHPEMVLGLDDIVEFLASWAPKPDSLTQIAERLNVGVDSLVFLDDNPVERELMRALRPEVATLEADHPAGYADLLIDSRLFVTLVSTEEDAVRTQRYHQRAARTELEQRATSLTDFLTDLDTCIQVEPMAPVDRDRVAQLFGKTNQCNLTGRRFSVSDLDALVAAGGEVLTVRAGDRFGDHGLVAAMAVARPGRSWHVENFVMSCRVFTRGIEHAVGSVLLARAAQAADSVEATFLATNKNGQFRGLYDDLGFVPLGSEPPPSGPGDPPTSWLHDLVDLPAIPSWITLAPPAVPSPSAIPTAPQIGEGR